MSSFRDLQRRAGELGIKTHGKGINAKWLEEQIALVEEDTEQSLIFPRDLPSLGEEGEFDLAHWIYGFVTDFMKEIGLKEVPKRELEWVEPFEGYFGVVIPGEGDQVSIINFSDNVELGEVTDTLEIEIEKPLHGEVSVRRLDHFLRELSHNLRILSLQGLPILEKRLLARLKENEIILANRYTLIPRSVTASLPEVKVPDRAAIVEVPTYALHFILTFDFIDEEAYKIGGEKYKEGEKRFTKKE